MFSYKFEAWVDNELANPTEKDYRGKMVGHRGPSARSSRWEVSHQPSGYVGNPGCVGMEDGSKHRHNPLNVVEVRKVALQ